MLTSVYRKFCIESKVVGCVTDNGSNFVKAFKNFGVGSTVSSLDVDEDVEEIEFCTIDLTDLYGSGTLDFGNDLNLPLHFRCAAHTLNLLATSDMEKILKANEDLGKYHDSLVKKCTKLWNASRRPKTAEVFEKYLKRKLPYPVTTRWNSLYDSLLVILENFSAIQIVSEHLNLKEFSKEEKAYLDAYVLCMKPIAIGLDKLQENSYLAFLLPTLFSIRKRLLELFDHNVGMVRKLATNLYHHLQDRFTKMLNLDTSDKRVFHCVVATFTHPKFKMLWTSEEEHHKIIKKAVLHAAQEMILADENDGNGSGTPGSTVSATDDDDFFDLHKNHQKKMDSTSKNNTTTTKSMTLTMTCIEAEVMLFASNKSSNLSSLNEHSNVKKLFLKFNCVTPSSGPVERLFSFATLLNAPRRQNMTAENFHRMLFLHGNKKRF